MNLTLDDAILHLDEMLDNPEFVWCNDDCKFEHFRLRQWLQELRDIKAKEFFNKHKRELEALKTHKAAITSLLGIEDVTEYFDAKSSYFLLENRLSFVCNKTTETVKMASELSEMLNDLTL